MPITNNLTRQVDLPVWEWMRFAPVNTSALSCLTTARDGSDRYLYYFGSNILYRYDTWNDSWQQLSTGITPVTPTLSVKHVKNKGFRGNVLGVPSSTSLTIPSVSSKELVGLKIRIIAGTGAGQERTITSVDEEIVHDSGLVTTATANVLTDTLKRWRFNQWEGYSVRVTYNTGFSQFREIIYNDTNSITVFDANYEGRNFLMTPFSSTAPYATPVATAGAQANFSIVSQRVVVDSPWTVTPTTDSKFMILSGGIWWISSNASTPFFNFYYYDLLSDRWVQKLTPTGIFSATLGTDFAITNTSEIVGSLISSTATTATTMTLVDTTQNMTRGDFIGSSIRITGGTGIGQERRIISNTNDTFIVSKRWSTTPNSTSQYSITGEDALYFEGNGRSQMLKYYPEPSVWGLSSITDDGITNQMGLIRSNGQHHAVSSANRVTNGITGVNPVPTAGGSGYVVGDLLTISTGGSLGRVIVESVSTAGAVLTVSLYTAGSGYSVGTGRATTGGAGTSCTIEITSVGTIGVLTTPINHDFIIGESFSFSGATEAAWNTSYSVLGIQSATILEILINATANAVNQFTLATNLLVDVSKNWTPGEHAGKILGLQANGLTGTLTFRRIIGNSTNTITFIAAGAAPTNGNSRYFIQELDALGRDLTYLADQELSYGYATSGTTGTLVDSTKNWTVGAFTNHKIKLIDISGNTVEDIVTTNTTSSLNVGRMVIGSEGTNTLSYSDNGGLTWIGLGATIFSTRCASIAWNGTRFVAVGQGTNGIAWSNDGITWVGLGTAVINQGWSVAWNGVRFVAGHSDGVAWSNDGITWNNVSVFTGNFGVLSIAWNGTRWVLGNDSVSNTLAYSTDGITWIGSVNILSPRVNSIVWNGVRFVGGGSNGLGNTIFHSTDGITWTGLGLILFTETSGIATNGTRMVAVGLGGANAIAYSDDGGLTWIGVTGTNIFTSATSVAWNGTRFVAVGQGNNRIAVSTDGITWIGLGNSVFSTNPGSIGSRIASTSPFLSLTPNIGISPASGTTYYQIYDAYGLATAGSTTSLTDANKRWKVNQWAGKRLLITSSTGVQQELTIASNTATALTFGTATAPDTTSTYTILGRPTIGLGIGLEWNWGMTGNTSDKGKILISPRGGGSHTFDRYDIRTNRWQYGDFIFGQGETLTTGAMYVYDGQNRLYFIHSAAVGRLFYYDILKKTIEPFATIPYGMGAAILGNRMEIIQTEDNLKYLYVMRHSSNEMWRTLIFC